MMLGFIGAGRMATAIAGGLIRGNAWSAESMLAADVDDHACEAFTEQTGVACTPDAARVIREADIILFAVKPQQADEALAGLPSVGAGQLIVSILAGFTLNRLQELFKSSRVVRVMPNTPMRIGEGVAAYTPADGVTETDTKAVEQIFAPVAIVQHVPEDAMDAVTAVSGSGPAYVFAFAEALTQAGIEEGLAPETAEQLTIQTLKGAAEMLYQGMGSAEELRKAVTSKGGTTAAGLNELEQGGFAHLIRRCVKAAAARSRELGRE